MAIHPNWNQPLPEWLSLQQAAALYGVSVDTCDAVSRRAACPPPASASGSFVFDPRISTASSGRFPPA